MHKLLAISLAPVVAVLAGCGSSSSSTSPTSASVTPSLYVETNAPSGNAVLAYARASSGALTAIGSYSTGANGAGLPTYAGALPFPIGGATGSVRLSPNGSYLYAVDAGSSDVAAFSVAANGSLTLIGRSPTNGTSPASIAIDSTGKYLYVLNTGSASNGNNTAGSITGFTIGSNGALTAIPSSTQNLSADTYVDPSEVAFSPDGSYLVVTEKATSMIDIYPVTSGVAGAAVSQPSSGAIPFGFAFTPSGTLVVANVESLKTPNASTVTSYTATSTGTLTPISNQVPDNQSATCWITLTSDGAYAYGVDTLGGSISGYSIASNGALTLLTANGETATQASTTGPIDDGVAPGNSFLYVLDSNAGASPGELAGFSIGSGGSLTAISTGITGLPEGSVGMAIR